jgi:glutamate/aspartate transport system substrate-binding protein
MYNKWFRARLLTGERLNIPMSAELEDSFNALGSATSTGN